jgi:hypothetical protein
MAATALTVKLVEEAEQSFEQLSQAVRKAKLLPKENFAEFVIGDPTAITFSHDQGRSASEKA